MNNVYDEDRPQASHCWSYRMHKNFWLLLLLLAFDFHVAGHDLISQYVSAVERSCVLLLCPTKLLVSLFVGGCSYVSSSLSEATFKSKNELHAIVNLSRLPYPSINRHTWYGTDLGIVRRTPDKTQVLIVPFVPKPRPRP